MVSHTSDSTPFKTTPYHVGFFQKILDEKHLQSIVVKLLVLAIGIFGDVCKNLVQTNVLFGGIAEHINIMWQYHYW